MSSKDKIMGKLINKFSSNIKDIEERLFKSKINIPFHFPITIEDESLHKRPTKDHNKYNIFNDLRSYTTRKIPCLAWDKDDKSEKFRLFLIYKEQELIHFGFEETYHYEELKELKILSKKYFIETNLKIKLKFARESILNAFTKAIERYWIKNNLLSPSNDKE